MATPISRRTLLRATGATSLAALLGACSSDPADTGSSSDGDDASSGSETDGDGQGQDATGAQDAETLDRQAIEAVGLDRAPTLTPIVATFEVLTGPTGRIPFGILDAESQPLLDRDVQLWVVSEGEVVTGPVAPLFYGEDLGQRGVYVAEVDLDEAGVFDVVVQVDGEEVGTAQMPVRTPEQSTAHPPGREFPEVATPTVDDPGELEDLCTREPQCSMHETSLVDALGDRPVVLTVATPRFCQTAVCGPVVNVVEQVRQRSGRDDVVFIHAEVYNDAGQTPTDVINELALPSEPWTWVIDADGVVADRFDGPVVPSLLDDAIGRV